MALHIYIYIYIYIYVCDISSLRVNGPSEPGRLRDVCVCQWVKNITYLDYVSPLVTFKRQEVIIYRDLSSDLDLDMHFIFFKLSEFDLLFAFLVVTCISLIINLLYVFRELCCHGMQLQRSALVPLLFDTFTFWHRNFTFKF